MTTTNLISFTFHSLSPLGRKGLRVALPCLMIFVVAIQLYQIHRLESSMGKNQHQQPGLESGGRFLQQQKQQHYVGVNSRSLTVSTADLTTQQQKPPTFVVTDSEEGSSSLRRDQKNKIIAEEDTTSSEEAEESFSACLMIMDDNPHLIEWLAYHYTTLPLRRVIVAVDPRSQTSPTSILQRWTGRMNITEWSEVDFMPPQIMDKHLHMDPTDHDGLTDLFRQRQEHFYTRCMARLKYEGRTWTAFVDTDEYILINKNAMAGYRVVPFEEQNTIAAQHMTVLDGIKRISIPQQNQHNDDKDNNRDINGDVLNIMSSASQQQTTQQYNLTSPCLAMARVAFGVKESETGHVQRNVPKMFLGGLFWKGFDGRDFQTLRWRYHSGRGAKKHNKISKSLLDVSMVESSLFIPHEQVMVHLPSKKYCHMGGSPAHLGGGGGGSRGNGSDGALEQHLWVLNGHSPIVVHHYSGTWEQWSHRKDTRGKRTWENYQKMAYDTSTDENIRPWLKLFVDQVGWWTALQLLAGVGEV
jgi:Glycosyltransferase family 92